MLQEARKVENHTDHCCPQSVMSYLLSLLPTIVTLQLRRKWGKLRWAWLELPDHHRYLRAIAACRHFIPIGNQCRHPPPLPVHWTHRPRRIVKPPCPQQTLPVVSARKVFMWYPHIVTPLYLKQTSPGVSVRKVCMWYPHIVTPLYLKQTSPGVGVRKVFMWYPHIVTSLYLKQTSPRVSVRKVCMWYSHIVTPLYLKQTLPGVSVRKVCMWYPHIVTPLCLKQTSPGVSTCTWRGSKCLCGTHTSQRNRQVFCDSRTSYRGLNVFIWYPDTPENWRFAVCYRKHVRGDWRVCVVPSHVKGAGGCPCGTETY